MITASTKKVKSCCCGDFLEDAELLTTDHPRVHQVLRDWQGSYAFRVIGFDGHEFRFAVINTKTKAEDYEIEAALQGDGKWHPSSPCTCPDRNIRKRPCKHEILFLAWGDLIPAPASDREQIPLTFVTGDLPHPADDPGATPPEEAPATDWADILGDWNGR